MEGAGVSSQTGGQLVSIFPARIGELAFAMILKVLAGIRETRRRRLYEVYEESSVPFAKPILGYGHRK